MLSLQIGVTRLNGERVVIHCYKQGVNVGIVGTTLPAMEVRTSSNTAEMSIIYIVIGVSTVVGSLVFGPLFDRMNGMLLLSVCLALTGVFTALAPTWTSLVAFHAMAAMMTFFISGLHPGELDIYEKLSRLSLAEKPHRVTMCLPCSLNSTEAVSS